MPPAALNWVMVGAVIIVAWRLLPPAQACVATIVCAGTLWLRLHPVMAAHLLTAVGRLGDAADPLRHW